MTVVQAITRAEKILPGKPAPKGKKDARWQAIIKVGEFIETNPEEVWAFVEKWARHPQADLRAAIATCLLEHLIEYHFDLVFPCVEAAAAKSRRFADTFCQCRKFGQAKKPANASRMDRLEKRLS